VGDGDGPALDEVGNFGEEVGREGEGVGVAEGVVAKVWPTVEAPEALPLAPDGTAPAAR
jgi:hypothetical protein